MTRPLSASPWKLLTLSGLVLGVCLFLPPFFSKTYAIETNSPLFEKNQEPVGKEKAAQPLALPEETPNPSPGIFSIFLRICLSLVFIAALIFVTVWGVKMVWERQGWNQGEQAKPIKVLSSTFLGPRKTIHLVEVGSRILVVGVGKDELNCLDVIDQPEEVASLREATQQGFPKLFARAVSQHETAQQESEARKIIAESSQLVGGYVEKLKKITKSRKDNNGPKENSK